MATNGDFYGTTFAGGANGQGGTVYEVTPSGTLTTLYNFCTVAGCADGNAPHGLVQAANGDFYGTTVAGGANGNWGTVFRITPSGQLTTLHSFCTETECTDGYSPSGLVQATNGDFYGTTDGGGTNQGGTVFKITPSGKLTTLYSFCAQAGCTDGYDPNASLVQATNGDLYGTTFLGGANGNGGTVFKITLSGTLTTLYSFCAETGCTDGFGPESGFVQAANGDLYGTTAQGGANGDGTLPTGGTVFKVTLGGMLTTLYSFCAETNCADGEDPYGGLVQAINGDLYGTTFSGGSLGAGAIFKIAPRGALTTLHNFCTETGCADGVSPTGLVEATSGILYGTTAYGGTDNAGTVFRLSAGLGPFVETLPAFGKVGAAIEILGTDLTGATSVTFNGIVATFTVVSATEITTRVPDGATTGTVQVTTPTGTLSSNATFRVQP
jgi:uncharacterized repeat protein (TIGR03803 family)